MFISCHQTTGQNHYIKAANKSFENVELKRLGKMLTIRIAFTSKLITD
jgi:hypothetical protein